MRSIISDAAVDHSTERTVLAQLLCQAVREAGALALDAVKAPLNVRAKDDASPVSDADIAVNTFLRHRLMTAAPDFGWISEESRDDPARLAAARLWVIDPIDGTR